MSQKKEERPDLIQEKKSRRHFMKSAVGAAGAGALGLSPRISEQIDRNSFSGIVFTGEVPKYEVYALKYGEMQALSNILWYWLGHPALAPNQPVTPKATYYRLIKGPDINVLFDAGTTLEAAEANHIAGYEDHATVLGKLDLKVEDIGALIISHTHADHLNGAKRFQENQDCLCYIQEACFKWAVEEFLKYPLLKKLGLPNWGDIQWLAQQLRQGRLKLVKGERAAKAVMLMPGVSVRRVDGHMVGLQIAIVQTARGLVVLTSDAAYLYSNLEMNWPVGLYMGSLTDAMDGLTVCKESGEILVPGHDMEVTKRFPEVRPGVYRIA